MHIGFYWLDQWLKYLSAVEQGLAQPRGVDETERSAMIAQVQSLRVGTEQAVTELEATRQALAAAENVGERRAAEIAELRQGLASAESAAAEASQAAASARAELDNARTELTELRAAAAQERNLLSLQISQLRQAVDNERMAAKAREAAAAADHRNVVGGITLHMRRPADWAEPVYIHYWDTQPAVPPTAWPGVAMTAEADGWFSYRLNGIAAATVIFNDGERQTDDMRRDGDGWFDTDRHWHDRKRGRGTRHR